jgi:hypothetical protein
VDSTGTSVNTAKSPVTFFVRVTTSWVVPDESWIGKKDIVLEALLFLWLVSCEAIDGGQRKLPLGEEPTGQDDTAANIGYGQSSTSMSAFRERAYYRFE